MLFCGSLAGQTVLEPSVISTNGGRIETATMTLDWTLGETFVSDSNIDGYRLTEGFHQPILTVEVIASPATTWAEKLQTSKTQTAREAGDRVAPPAAETTASVAIAIWPNPVCENLTIRVNSDELANVHLQLFDAQGHLLERNDRQPVNSAFEMQMNARPNGLYFLHFSSPDGKPLGSRKITLAR